MKDFGFIENGETKVTRTKHVVKGTNVKDNLHLTEEISLPMSAVESLNETAQVKIPVRIYIHIFQMTYKEMSIPAKKNR